MHQREAEKDLVGPAGGSAWEKTPEPVLRDKNQVKIGQNAANQRRTMSGPTLARGVELNVGVEQREADISRKG